MQVLGHIPAAGQESSISWQCVDSQSVTYDDVVWELLNYVPTGKIKFGSIQI